MILILVMHSTLNLNDKRYGKPGEDRGIVNRVVEKV